jgi:hypothetical protein
MSISVVGAFSRMGIQAPSVPSANISEPKGTTEEIANRTPDPPRLHGEILYKVFNILHDESPSLLYPVLQVSPLCYKLVMPILYRTVYLNRSTLRGLMHDPDERRCWGWYWYNRPGLARTTTLIIDDLFVLFDTRYDAALRDFCHHVRLPNVTKVIIRHNRQTAAKFKYHYGEFEFFVARRPLVCNHTMTPPQTYKPHQQSRANMFTHALPNKSKSICVSISSNDNFQNLTNDRILEYVSWLCGDNQIRIHQPVNPNFLTLNIDQRHPHVRKSASTVYSFYRDLSGTPARPQLLRAFEILLNRQVKPVVDGYLPKWTDLFPKFVELVNGDDRSVDILESMRQAIASPSLRLHPECEPFGRGLLRLRTLENVFAEMLVALSPDSKTACPCCGEVGAPLNL